MCLIIRVKHFKTEPFTITKTNSRDTNYLTRFLLISCIKVNMSKASEMAPFTQTEYGYPSANQLFISDEPTSAVIPTALKSEYSPLCIALTQRGPIASESLGNQMKSLTPGATSQSSNTTTTSSEPNDSERPLVCKQFGQLSSKPCCENGRIILADPLSGKTVCTCQGDSTRIALSNYTCPQPAAANMGVCATPFSTSDQSPYRSIGVNGSAFYPALSNPYPLKDNNRSSDMNALTSAGLHSTTGFFSYDPSLAAYGYGASYDLAARRKNATRESTATLKAWLNEHKKNPYPTKGEKIMLAIITKMTLTQVSTWFANARRRLKKENKMTWEPKHRTEDDDDANANPSDEEKDREEYENSSRCTNGAVIVTTGIVEGNVSGVDVPSSLEEVGVVGGQPKGYLSNPTSGNPEIFPISHSLNMQQQFDTEIQKQPQNKITQMQADLNTSGAKTIPNIWSLGRVHTSQHYNLSSDQQNHTSFVATLSIHANNSNYGNALRNILVPKPMDVTAVPPQSSYQNSPINKDQCCT